ncbi:MAG: PTS system mannose/fructose/sorbose family transporter subunit IID [Deferribacterota bacterium]|nr:PTS system mannose/fructose/sorbose family transporter subunit IID [Deferribacterota bacterium]
MKRMDKIKLLMKSLVYQGNWNYDNMQGTGFYYLLKSLRKLGYVKVDKQHLRENTGYFNTNPYFITIILGVWCKEYIDGLNTKFAKDVYSPALSGLGDRFFWHTLKPLTFIISVIICFYDPLLSLIFYLLFFNIFHFFFLYNGFDIGYNYGKNVIEWFNKIRFNKWNTYGEVVILFAAGVFLALLYKNQIYNTDYSILLIYVIILLVTLLIVKKIYISLALFVYTTLLLINLVVGLY